MNCPFCNAKMEDKGDYFICPGGGPLLTKESGPCPYQGEDLTHARIAHINTFLIDNDGGD